MASALILSSVLFTWFHTHLELIKATSKYVVLVPEMALMEKENKNSGTGPMFPLLFAFMFEGVLRNK